MDTTGRSLPPRDLLKDFVRMYPFQPATAFWRWIETDVILRFSPAQGRGLDLGCGDGKLTQLIAGRLGGWAMVGVDPDEKEIELARDCPLYERLHSTGGDSIPEPDASFDFVFSNCVLEHIPDVRPVLREARRLLKPGGVFLFTVPSSDFHDCLAGPPVSWRLLFRSGRNRYLEEFDRRIAHQYYWRDSRWEHELREVGFKSVQIDPYMERSLVHRWEALANITSGLLYKVRGGKEPPIEIQRKFGMRKKGWRTPSVLVPVVSRMLTIRLQVHAGFPPLYGGRMIRAYA